MKSEICDLSRPTLASAIVLAAALACAPAQSQEFDPAAFDDRSHIINNKWWPVVPGTQMVYEGEADADGERVEHRFVDTVTDLTKVVGGVRALVSLEEDFQDGELIEREIAFHAQDKDGNVWHLGQLREVYDEHELVGLRVWVVGAPDGAKAGVRMEADPKVGNPEYSQGWAPDPFNWTDRAKVAEVGLDVTVPAGGFSGVMVIDEHDDETAEGVYQTKFYARDVGLVQIGYRGPDPEREELFLVEVKSLEPEEMDAVRALVLEMESRAYLYNATSPARRIDE